MDGGGDEHIEGDCDLDEWEGLYGPRGLTRVIDVVTVPALDGVDVTEHRDLLDDIERQIRTLEAQRASVIASAERQGHHLVDGHRGPAAWMRATIDVSPPMSHRLVARARLLARERALDIALRIGRISVEHVDIIAHYAAPEYAAENLSAYVPALLDAADRLPYEDFVLVVRHWQLTVDPGTELNADERARENRKVRVRRRRDGSWSVLGDLPSADGTVLDATFARFLEAETLADWDAARALKGELATSADLPRSLDQRRADAFMAMVRHSARPDVGAEPEPLVELVVDLRTLGNALRSLGASLGVDDPADPTWWHNRACRTRSGHPVTTADMIAAVIVGKVRPIVVDDVGRITHVGRTQRYFSPAVQEGLRALSPHCVWPGCTTAHTEGDHVHPFSSGGSSDPDNAAAVCGRHNRWRHANGYRLRRHGDGTWAAVRPDGSYLGSDP